MEKLFHMAVVLAAGATTVYLMTKAQLSARGNALVDDEIDEVAPRDVTDVEESEEDADMLSTYWAGAIPEGMLLMHFSHPFCDIVSILLSNCLG